MWMFYLRLGGPLSVFPQHVLLFFGNSACAIQPERAAHFPLRRVFSSDPQIPSTFSLLILATGRLSCL